VTISWKGLPLSLGMLVLDEPQGVAGDLRVMTVRVDSILCRLCAERATTALLGLPGVREARLLWEEDRAVVVYLPGEVADGGEDPLSSTAEVCEWAAKVMETIEAVVVSSDHHEACGLPTGPDLLV
jgi:hypothetical protein